MPPLPRLPSMMKKRRHFLASAPALAALGAASTPSRAGDVPASDAELQRQMRGKLTAELGDSVVAGSETGYLFDTFFSWLPPAIDPAGINAIVAYAFGNRAGGGAGAMPVPGPVNEQIADAVFQLQRKTPVPIYAQWEIAQVLASKYALGGVVSVAPPVVANGKVSTPALDGVATAVIKQAGTAAALGNVAVVTHRDQASLAVQTSNAQGMKAGVAAGLGLPLAYDTSALQPSNRRRDLYLLTSAGSQLGTLRLALIAQEYPNG